MKKLLLASVFKNVADKLPPLLLKSVTDSTVVFVPTAADVYNDQWFIKADRQILVDMGFKIIDLPLKDKTKDEVEQTLNMADVIFVGGGNTFYLLDHARKSGFAELVPKFVEKGVVYVGSSAGNYLTCPTIEAATWKNQDKNIVGMTNFTALNLVPFLLFAHYKPEHNDLLKLEIPKTKYQVRIVNDDQAILVQDNNSQLVGKGEEIKM